jgi:Mg/Co/Ni transporter MgtE
MEAPVGEVLRAIRSGGWDFAIVVDPHRMVLGRVRERGASEAVARDPSLPVERVMKEGPSTFRPNVSVSEMLDYLLAHDLEDALVTTSEGVLIGAVRRSTLQGTSTTLKRSEPGAMSRSKAR